ncbi:MAG: DPP IV N-terminal domain-containing protein [Aigarchaeota archaeon]|nr:DPP IV N-terminal domain-containing protein [Candidatus Pelearchaeum maunauluense]
MRLGIAALIGAITLTSVATAEKDAAYTKPGTAGAAYPQWTQDGGRIIYYQRGDIWIINLRTLERSMLVVEPYWDTLPALSPSGSVLAFTSERIYGGRTTVCLKRLSEERLRCIAPLAELTYTCGPQTWTASGEKPLICSTRPMIAEQGITWLSELWILTLKTNSHERIASYVGIISAAWSQKNGLILVSNRTRKDANIWLLNPETRESTLLIRGGSYPAWSPNGKLVAYSVDGDVWVMELHSQRRWRITSGEHLETTPAWSPDGRRIAYAKLAQPIDEATEQEGIIIAEAPEKEERKPPTTLVMTAAALAALLTIMATRGRRAHVEKSHIATRASRIPKPCLSVIGSRRTRNASRIVTTG